MQKLPKLKFLAIKKIAPYAGTETGGYITADEDIIPVKNELDSPEAYKMNARERWVARSKGGIIAIHTHPEGENYPSAKDFGISRRYPRSTFAVWHPRSGVVWYYKNGEVIDHTRIRYPLWFKLLALILWR